MDIIFHGMHDGEEAVQSMASVLKLLQDQYKIHYFHEIHLSVTLVDAQGEDVELIDSHTGEVYRKFEICKEQLILTPTQKSKPLHLVVDNTLDKK